MGRLDPVPAARCDATLTGAAVKMAEDRGCALSDLSVSDLRSIHPLFADDVTAVCARGGRGGLAMTSSWAGMYCASEAIVGYCFLRSIVSFYIPGHHCLLEKHA
jgi:hypothetical protein